MSALTDRIRARGFVEVVVRPAKFLKDRIPYSDLEDTVRSAQVQLGGWDFPHVGREAKEVLRGEDWFGSESQWEHRLEAFRLYQSGLLVDLRGFGWDWRDESSFWPAGEGWAANDSLSVVDTLYRFVETFLVASRLGGGPGGDDALKLRMKLGNLEGRKLLMPERVFSATWGTDRTTAMQEYEIQREYSRLDLTSRARELALSEASQFFERFGWKPEPSVLVPLISV